MDEEILTGSLGQIPAVIVGNVVDMANGDYSIAAGATTVALVVMAKQAGLTLEQVVSQVTRVYQQLRVIDIDVARLSGEEPS